MVLVNIGTFGMCQCSYKGVVVVGRPTHHVVGGAAVAIDDWTPSIGTTSVPIGSLGVHLGRGDFTRRSTIRLRGVDGEG